MISKLPKTHWKVLSSDCIAQDGQWLNVRKEKVQLPNGVIIPSWYIMDFPDWINVIAITRDGMFVMESQYRHGIRQTRYELCAGVVEEGEEPLHAAQRELMEETGFGGGEWTAFMTLSPNPTNQSNFSHTFVAIGVEQIDRPHQESTEDIKTHLLTRQEVETLLQRGEIVQAMHAAPLYKYLYDTKK